MKIYIAGKIAGDDGYREKFRAAQEELEGQGYIVLNPANSPEGMSKADYMRICFAMIDCADAVYFLPDWTDSPGAQLEYRYCRYVGKKIKGDEIDQVREKLIELFDGWRKGDYIEARVDSIVDHLIANGVTVQELDGCEFCNDTIKRFPYILAVSDIGDCGTVFKPISCPRCGRKLTEQPQEGD